MAYNIVILSTMLAVATAGYIAQAPSHYAVSSPSVITKIVNPSVDAVASTHQNVIRTSSGTVAQHSKSIQTPYSSVHKEDTRITNNVHTPTLTKTVTYAAPEASSRYTSHSSPLLSKTYYGTPQIHGEDQSHIYTSAVAPTAAVYTQNAPATHVFVPSAPSTVLYTHSGPSNKIYAAAPTASVYTHLEPTSNLYHHQVPSTAATTYKHGPGAVVYDHEAPSASVTTTYSHNSPTAVYHQDVIPSTATAYHHSPPSSAVFQHEAPSAAVTTYSHGPAATTYSHNGHGVAAYGTSQTVHYSPAEAVSHMSFDGFGTHWGF